MALFAVIAAIAAPSGLAKADQGFGPADFESTPSVGITDASWAE